MKPLREQQKAVRKARGRTAAAFGLVFASDASRVLLLQRRPLLCSIAPSSARTQLTPNPTCEQSQPAYRKFMSRTHYESSKYPTSKVYAQQDVKLSDPKQTRARCARAHSGLSCARMHCVRTNQQVHVQASYIKTCEPGI